MKLNLKSIQVRDLIIPFYMELFTDKFIIENERKFKSQKIFCTLPMCFMMATKRIYMMVRI